MPWFPCRSARSRQESPVDFPDPKPSRHLCEGTPCSAGCLGGGRRSMSARVHTHPPTPNRLRLFCVTTNGTFLPLTCCRRWISVPVYRVPAGHERLLSTRGSLVGSRAPRGEDTSEPVPRLLPGASGAVRAANGRFATPILPQKPNQKTIWFGFCFALISTLMPA